MSSTHSLFPVTIFQEKIIFFVLVLLLGSVALLGAIFGSTPGALFLFALGVAFLGAFLFPRSAIFAMLALTILFERFFTLQPLVLGKTVLKVYPMDMVILGLLLAFVVFWLLFRHRKNVWAWPDIWLMLFFAYTTLLFLLSVFGIGGSDSSVAFSTWKQYVFYGSFFFLIRLAVYGIADLKALLRVIFISISLTLIFLIIGILNGEGLWSEYTPLSTVGVRILAFPHALYFSLALITAFLLLATDVVRDKYRTALFALVPLLAVGIVGSLMRHLWLGLAAAFIVGFLMLSGKQRIFFIRNSGASLGIFTVFATIFLSILTLFPHSSFTESVLYSGDILSTRVTSIGDSYDESAVWRGAVWQSAFKRFSEHPFIGIGLGNSVPVEIGEYRDIIEVRNIHNSWFALIVQTGLIGSVLFGLFLFSLLWQVFRMETSKETVMITRAILLSMSVFFTLVFFFQPYLETNLLAFFFWVMLGIMAIITRKEFFEQ